MAYIYLIIAIIGEVIGTAALKTSEGFTKLNPSLLVILGYGIAFYFLALTLREMPVGVAYAIWAGLGIVLVSFISTLFFHQRLDLIGVIGILFIIIGIVLLNLFSEINLH